MNQHQTDVEHFNTAAPQWDEDPGWVLVGQKVGRAIRNALQPQGHEEVLEFGAGTGLATLLMAPKVAQLTALDNSAGMLEVLRDKCERKGLANVQALEGSIIDVPLAQYDLIYSAFTLHHVQDVPALLRRLLAHMKPGARIALADLDAGDGSGHDQDQDFFHHGFKRETVGAWLQEAGLVDVQLSTAWTVQRQQDDGSSISHLIFLAVASKPREG